MLRSAFLVLVFWLSLCVHSFSQQFFVPSAASVALADVQSLSLWSPLSDSNPATAALGSESFVVSVDGGVPYSLADLAQARGSLLWRPAAGVSSGVSLVAHASRSGSSLSHFSSFGGFVSRRFGPHLALGVGYDGLVHSLRYADRASVSSSSVGAALAIPHTSLLLCVAVRNAERRRLVYPSRSVPFPTTAWVGLRFSGSSVFAVCVEAQKESRLPLVGRLALALYPARGLTASVGFSSEGNKLSAGAAYRWQRVGVGAAVSRHQQLGVSSAANIEFYVP